MNKLLLAIAALGYGMFWRWYSAPQKPLTHEEVERYVAKLTVMGTKPAVIERMRAFLAADTGRSFVMVNLMKLYDLPPHGNAGETSANLLRRYTSAFLPTILRRAGHPVLVGTAAAPALEVWGLPDAEQWGTVGLVRYRSRRDMIESVIDPHFAAIHPFKQAAMEKTIAVPLDPWFYAGDPRLIVGLLLLMMALMARK